MKNKKELKTESYIVEFYDWVDNWDETSVVKDLTYFKKTYSSCSTLFDLLTKFQTKEEEIFSRIKINDSGILYEISFNAYSWLGSNKNTIIVQDNEVIEDDIINENYMIGFRYHIENLNNLENLKNIEGFIIQQLWDKQNDINQLFNTEELAIDSFYNKIRSKVEIVVNVNENELEVLLDYDLSNKREDLKNYSISKVLSLAKEFQTILEQAIITIN